MVIIDFTLCSYFAAAVLLLMLFQAALSPFVSPYISVYSVFCILYILICVSLKASFCLHFMAWKLLKIICCWPSSMHFIMAFCCRYI